MRSWLRMKNSRAASRRSTKESLKDAARPIKCSLAVWMQVNRRLKAHGDNKTRRQLEELERTTARHQLRLGSASLCRQERCRHLAIPRQNLAATSWTWSGSFTDWWSRFDANWDALNATGRPAKEDGACPSESPTPPIWMHRPRRRDLGSRDLLGHASAVALRLDAGGRCYIRRNLAIGHFSTARCEPGNPCDDRSPELSMQPGEHQRIRSSDESLPGSSHGVCAIRAPGRRHRRSGNN